MSEATGRVSDVSRFVPDDRSLAVAQMLNQPDVARWLTSYAGVNEDEASRCSLGYTRYDPEKSCTVRYELQRDAHQVTPPIDLYATGFSPGRFAEIKREVEKRTWLPGKVLPQPIFIPEARAVLYEFPNDRKLPILSLLAKPELLAATMFASGAADTPQPTGETKWSVIRYKPERRVVGRLQLRQKNGAVSNKTTIIRFERSSDFLPTVKLLGRLAARFNDDGSIGFPRVVLCDATRSFYGLAGVPGRKLSTLLRSDNADSAIRRTARALAKLHDYHDTDLGIRTITDLLQTVQRRALSLGSSDPELRAMLEQITQRVVAVAGSTDVGHIGFVHGDFHQGQALLDDEVVYFLDFERSHVGDVLADVGNFVGQMHFLDIKGRMPDAGDRCAEFVRAYEQARGGSICVERVNVWAAVALLELATKEFRRLKPGWPQTARKILVKSSSILDWRHHE